MRWLNKRWSASQGWTALPPQCPSGRSLWLAAPAGDLPTAKLLGFRIGHVELAHALSSVGIRNTNRRTLSFWDLGTRHVRHTNHLAGQTNLLVALRLTIHRLSY